MNVLFAILTVLVLIASILVTLIVLLQNGKGGGLASNFAAGNQTFGVRQTADILEKVTWGLVAFILVLAIITSFTTGTTGADIDVSNKIENITPQATPDFAPVPQEIPSQTNPTE